MCATRLSKHTHTKQKLPLRPSQTPQYWKQKHCHTRYPPLRPTPVSPVPRVLCDEKKKNEKLNEKETPRLLND